MINRKQFTLFCERTDFDGVMKSLSETDNLI